MKTVFVVTIGNAIQGVYSSWRLAYVAFMNWLCRNPEWHISKTSNKVIYDEFKLSCPQNEDKMASIEQVFFNNQYWLKYLEEDE